MIEIIRGGALLKRKLKPTKTFMVMRLTALILLITGLHVSAAGWAQKVTLNEHDAPLKKILT